MRYQTITFLLFLLLATFLHFCSFLLLFWYLLHPLFLHLLLLAYVLFLFCYYYLYWFCISLPSVLSPIPLPSPTDSQSLCNLIASEHFLHLQDKTVQILSPSFYTRTQEVTNCTCLSVFANAKNNDKGIHVAHSSCYFHERRHDD